MNTGRRFIVCGAGAVGGVVGGRLFQHGHDVVLVARGAHARAIAERGLRLQSSGDEQLLHVPVVDDIGQLSFRDGDIVLLAVKSQDTRDVALALASHAPLDTPIVSLQNGVANEPTLLRWFANVSGICVMLPSTHLEPGVVQAKSAPVSGLLDIGRFPAGVDGHARAVSAALESSSFESIPRPDIMRWKYTKLLMNLGNAVDATCAPGDDASELVRRARSEGASALRTAGIAAASADEDRERRGDRLAIRPIAGTDRGGGSSWQSLARGTGSIETDYLNGEIVLLGRRHGIATPVNELLCRVANRAARDGLAPRSLDARGLLDSLDRNRARG